MVSESTNSFHELQFIALLIFINFGIICRYHVPRSFMPDDVNTLVLFEEFGGNPSLVNFQTVAAGSVCGNAYENNVMELSCHGQPISAIRFASFGDVDGTCGSFRTGSCKSSKDVMSIVQNVSINIVYLVLYYLLNTILVMV